MTSPIPWSSKLIKPRYLRKNVKFRPKKRAFQPLYKDSRLPFTHQLPRSEFLKNPVVKYPVYERLPKFWRDEYEFERPKLHQEVSVGTKRPQHEGLWRTGEDGHPELANNFRVTTYYPPESTKEIWGGEGLVVGFRCGKDKPHAREINYKHWRPVRRERTFYSEILDRKITTKFTDLALDMIDAAYGFDAFVLETHSKVLQAFGSSLKREMLLKLARKDKDLYPDDPGKREEIYHKYKKYVIPEGEAEWVGLSLVEAMHKQWDIEENAGLHKPAPLLEIYKKELMDKLTGSSQVHVFNMSDDQSKPAT